MATFSADIEQFIVSSVEGLDEEKEKGRGCFGAVYEVRLHGLPCIAKRLHNILVGRGREEQVSDEQRRIVIGRFREECKLLSGLRHPNVVQFMGVHYGGRDEADISLIMEYMHMDIDQCMKTYPNIPLPYKTSILRDVAYGLAYLHSIPIIHRDLNAGNVLLTESFRAKIADLGVAKLFEMDTLLHSTKSTCPGASGYMPPESFKKRPNYGVKLDVFSFGHLTIYVSNQQYPVPIDYDITQQDLQNRQMQVAKRREALDQMGGPGHSLYSIAVQCLNDSPDQRPTSRGLVRRMEELCEKHPLPRKNVLDLTRMFEREASTLDQNLSDMRNHAEEMTHKLEEKSELLENEKYKNCSLSQDKSDLIEQLQIKTAKIEELTERIHRQEASYTDLSAEFNSLQRLHTREAELHREVSERLNIKQCRIDELEEKITVAEKQAETFKEDFEQERADRERKHTEYYEIKEESSVRIKQLEKQLITCRRELEEERRKRTSCHYSQDQRPTGRLELHQVASGSVQGTRRRRRQLELTSSSKPEK